MADEQQPMRPGRQTTTGAPAGRLKSGNTVNVGRLRKEFRLMACSGAKYGVEYWAKVAAGKKCIPIYNRERTKRIGYRYPTHDEVIECSEKLAKYGPGTSDKLEVEDVTPIDKQALRKQLIRRALEQGGGSEST